MQTLVDFVYAIALTMGLMGNPDIDVNPTVPVQGGNMEICYNFGPNPPSEVKLKIEFELEDGTKAKQTITLKPSGGCKTIIVPDTAVDYLVSDESGAAPPLGGIVEIGDSDG